MKGFRLAVAVLSFSLSAFATPAISTLSPVAGTIGTQVTIAGSGFGTSQGSSTVKFNGTTATIVSGSWTSTSIKALVPSGATTGNVVVTVNSAASNGVSFAVVKITSLSPTTGAPGSTVTVNGSGFGASQGNSTVSIGGINAAVVANGWTATSINAIVPSNAPIGTIAVTVTVNAVVSNSVNDTTVAPPVITSLSPGAGTIGTQVTISGTGFGSTQGSGTVKFNGVLASIVANSWAATSIKAIVPTGATSGNVVVHTSGVDSNGKVFNIASITSLSPSSGIRGSTVTINGSGFGTTPGTVQFGTISATVTAPWTDTKVTAVVPPAVAIGSTSVKVITGGVTSNGATFNVLQGPVITSLVPAAGTVGTVVTINGSGFGTTQGTVTLSGIQATITPPWSDTSVTATVPGNATTGNVVVTAGGVASAGSNFTVLQFWSKTGSLIASRNGATATLLNNGKVLVVGGLDSNSNSLASAEVYDPASGTFAATGALSTARSGHTATLLANGEVLVVGGIGNSFPPLATAELYDPNSGTFTLVNSNLNQDRFLHTATLLQNGLVLIVGGQDDNSFTRAGAELYDPVAQTFTLTGNLQTSSSNHTATLLNNGKVLIAGGQTWDTTRGYREIARAEIFDPTTGTFSPTGSLNAKRNFHAAALLNNGNVLITGGVSSSSSLASAELFNPATGIFTITGTMNASRYNHSVTLLSSGKVLVAGGYNPTTFTALNIGELYDPATATFSYTSALNIGRFSHTALSLDNGNVLAAGGSDGNVPLATAELYQPAASSPAGLVSIAVSPSSPTISGGTSQQFTATGTFTDNSTQTLASVTWSSSANTVATITNDPSNRGVAFGLTGGTTTISACAGSICGSRTLTVTVAPPNIIALSQAAGLAGTAITISGANFGFQQLSSTITFNGTPATPTSWYTGSIVVSVPAGATTGNIVVTVGGLASNGANFIVGTLNSIAISPATPAVRVGNTLQLAATGAYSDGSTLNLTTAVAWSSSAPNNGTIGNTGLVTGIHTGQATIQAVFGSVTGSIALTVNSILQMTGNMSTPREGHTATLLPNGKVLVAGGWANPFPTTSELYDPATGAFALTGSLHTPRYLHTATLLGDGLVLISGGLMQHQSSGGNFLETSSAELFDSSSGSFLPTNSLNTARYNHTATLLSNGRVLIAGGRDMAGNIVAAAELYDPLSGTFASAGNMNFAREGHTATTLNDGRVLISSGVGPNFTDPDTAELYNPATGTFTLAGHPLLLGEGGAATILNNGNVLYGAGLFLALYNTPSASYSNVTLGSGAGSALTLLNNGEAFLTGGGGLDTAGLYDPVAGTFSSLGGMNTVRGLHTATKLTDGRVLLAGGVDGGSAILASAEIYTPTSLTPGNLVSIAVSPASSSFATDTFQTFAATGTFSDNSTQALASVVWSSSDNSVLVVSNDASNRGQAYGLKAGAVTLRACAGTICGSASISVGAVAPNIASLTPALGTVGTVVTVTGNGFGPLQGSSTVTFNGAVATATRWYPNTIDATVPTTASSGPVVVTIAGVASNGVPFTMPRVITSLSATTAAPGTSITISGSNFGSSIGIVTFNGQAATTQSWTNNSIVAIVPATASSGNVVVSNAGIPSNGIPFTVGPVIYSSERTITIDHTKVPNSDQANFPVLVSGTYSYLATVANGGKVQNANGYDIIFTSDAAGNNKLDHEIETYDPATGTINFWVRIPVLSHTADTVIYLQYGSPVVVSSQENKTGVWDVNYQMVLHIGETAAPYRDSTTNGYSSSGGNSPAQSQGKVGQAQFFSGAASQYISYLPTQSPSLANALTLETWIKTTQNTPNQVNILGKWTNGLFGSDTYELLFGSNSTSAEGLLYAADGSLIQPTGSAVINDNNWHHLALSAPTTGQIVLYIDGIPNASFNNVGHPLLATGNQSLFVGGSPTGSMTGSLDEVRISSAARSADWIVAEYNDQASVSTFYSAGLENAPSVTTITPSSAEPGTSITIAGNGFTGTSGSVTINGHTATVQSWSNSSIVAIVPNGTTTGPLIVSAGGGQTNPVSFTVLLPVIASVGPNVGDPGTTVLITGANFDPVQGSGGVTVGGISAPIVSWNATSISALVPSGAVTGNVLVFAPYGETSNAVPFTVTDNFGIVFFSPSTGPVGTSVAILGGGFGATQGNSSVSFDGVAATITSWSDTQIIATVPETGTGPITVALDAGGSTQSATFFVVGTNVQVTDSLGNTSSYSSTIVGGAWHASFMQGSGCSSCSIRGALNQTFDTLGNTLTNTDELGHRTAYTYDADSNMLSQAVYLDINTPVTTSYTYNSFGEPLTVTDPLGNTTTNTYDTNGNLLTVTSPAPNGTTSASVTQFAYDTKGELTQITDPLSHTTTLAYNTVGLISTITDAQSNVTGYEYDLRGNRTAVVDAQQNRTTFTYDAGNRLTTITYPGSTSVSFAYDSRGRRTSVTDQNGKVTAYAYDDADRLVSVTDAAQNVTQYAYDFENNLLSITDAAGHVTSFIYDAFGRVTKTSFPSTLAESYVYDAIGNLTSKKDRKGQQIQYVYDALSRLTHKGYPDATGVDYVYDLVGKIKQVTDPTGTYGMAYDNMGRLLGTTTQYSFLPGHTYTNTYSYDAVSNRTQFTAPDGSTNTYAYDTLNRLTTLTNSLTGQFGFSYDALSRRTTLNRPNGVNTTYGYDSLSRLLNVLHKAGTVTLDGAGYAYDNAGNRTSKTNYLNNITEQYTYDPTYQLTQVAQGTTTTESYSYDAVGNRLSSLGMSSYAYNSSNQLTSTPAATYTYDANGNTLSKTNSSGTTQYGWDFENRLSSAVVPGVGTTTFRYDPFGKRIQKSGPNRTVNYVYEGPDAVEELDAGGNEISRYTHNRGIDEPLAELRLGTTGFYQADGLDSITSLSGATGTISNSYTYDTFGNITASTGSFVNPYQFTGRDFDPETGLRYYRARYYDPQGGRFLSEDPMAGGGISAFAYTDNNPLSWVDPFGLTPRPPRCPSQRQDISRSQLNRMIGALSATDSANLDRGCIGMTSTYQGMHVTFPETARGTKCFTTEAEARAHTCPSGQKKFIFAKQGQYEHGPPTPGPDGQVPRDTISSAGGNYNYVAAFPGGCYGWMNNGVYAGSPPQQATIAPYYPNDVHYPHTIWCSTCCSTCQSSR